MARRRMFSLDVVDTDAFLDLPASTQALYFHLGMRADDDGFVSAPRKITKLTNCSADDLKLLVAKGLIIPFNSGICVITDWHRNNYLKSDRHQPTTHTAEMGVLSVENKRYSLQDPASIQDVSKVYPQFSLDKVSLDKESSSLTREGEQQPQLSPAPLMESVRAYAEELGASEEEAAKFFDYNAARGWLVSGKPCADWKALFRSWMSHATPATKSGKTEQELIEESRLYSL